MAGAVTAADLRTLCNRLGVLRSRCQLLFQTCTVCMRLLHTFLNMSPLDNLCMSPTQPLNLNRFQESSRNTLLIHHFLQMFHLGMVGMHPYHPLEMSPLGILYTERHCLNRVQLGMDCMSFVRVQESFHLGMFCMSSLSCPSILLKYTVYTNSLRTSMAPNVFHLSMVNKLLLIH